MSNLRGIDVSEHNAALNWSHIKNTGEVDFAIIRGGYATTNDLQVFNNISGCVGNNIPIGFYWFSYALTEQDAIAEANSLISVLRTAGITSVPHGLWYDWEYDSDDYATRQGVTITNSIRERFARLFCDTCITAGFSCGLYSNPDYLTKGFQPLINDGYPLWLAEWSVSQPSVNCSIWQYGLTTISGLQMQFDGNVIGDGYTPPTPPTPPTPTNRKKLPFYMYFRRKFY